MKIQAQNRKKLKYKKVIENDMKVRTVSWKVKKMKNKKS